MSDEAVFPNTDAATGEDLAAAARLLRDPATIRSRCDRIAQHVSRGDSEHFTIDPVALPAVALRVAALTRSRFADLRSIPYHSRWRHFEAGGHQRKTELDARLIGNDTATVARARIDLTLVSVLLDAGAGADWRYQEAATGHTCVRSEGLGVASFRAFLAGAFSTDPRDPCRVDAAALLAVDEAQLAGIFQVSADNPLVGLAGRADLLRRLGRALQAQPDWFGADGRPGRLFDVLTAPGAGPVTAAGILGALLTAFSTIWPSGQWLGDQALGDVWPHPAAGGEGASAGRVPFHKLSQWLSYSLLEPFEWAGVPVIGLDALTGLPEYRNGGLLIDSAVIVPRDPAFAARARTPDEPWVIEWRALTVHLLDALAPLVRTALGASAEQLPLACILEGGTWAAGRQIAAELRPGGPPPVQITSDGTIF